MNEQTRRLCELAKQRLPGLPRGAKCLADYPENKRAAIQAKWLNYERKRELYEQIKEARAQIAGQIAWLRSDIESTREKLRRCLVPYDY